MKNQNLKPKYKLLVLMDLAHPSRPALRNAIHLAKIINGSIEVFYAKTPTEVMKYENQISAKWALEEDRKAIDKKLRDLINHVSGEENIPIVYNISLGNVQNELKDYIEKTKPDIVVLGKRKKKWVNFLGNGVTQFIMNRHSGAILIAGEDENFLSNSEISMGFYSDTLGDHNVEITKELSKRTKAIVKFFGVRRKSIDNIEKSTIARIKSDHNVQDATEYEFEEGVNELEGLANYVSKNNIGVLCVGRGRKKNAWSDRFIGDRAKVNRAVQKLNVPLLIMGDS